MDIIIRTPSGSQYILVPQNHDQADLAPSQRITAAQHIRDTLSKAQPVAPSSWAKLWQAVKSPGAEPLTDETAIRQAVQQLIQRQQWFLAHYKPLEISKNNQGATGGSGENAAPKEVAHEGPGVVGPQHTLGPDSSGPKRDEKTAEPSNEGVQPPGQGPEAGEPISMVTGEELLPLTDGELPGPMPFAWTRTYRSSHCGRDIGLGHGWTHSASERLDLNGDKLLYRDADGRVITFKNPKLHQVSRYLPEGLTLERLSNHGYLLRQDGYWHRVFVQLAPHSNHYPLSQLRHPSYRPTQTLLGEFEPERGFAINVHYNAHQQLTRLQGNWGKTLQFKRNTEGRIAQVVLEDHARQQSKVLTQYDYDAAGDLIAQRNAQGVREQYRYDHHLIAQRTLKTGFNYYFEWDRPGPDARCVRQWGDRGIYDYRFEWQPEQQRSRATDSRGHTREYHYNEYGQVLAERDPEGGLHQYLYHRGRKQRYTDPEGNSTEYLYDPDDRPAGVCDALGQRLTLAYFKGNPIRLTDKDKSLWLREYDNQDRLTALTDPAGNTTRYAYNSDGLLTQVTDPTGQATRYQWSAVGELRAVTDPQGHTRLFQYDAWGQVTQVDLRLKDQQPKPVVRISYNTTGQIEKTVAANGDTHTYSYNDNDQLIRYSDPKGRITEWRYDGLSQVVERIDPEGHRLRYEYDSERNLTALINEKGERHQFFYDGNERLIKEIGFDGRIQHYKYNQAGHLIKHLDAGEVITEFERDALGQLRTQTRRALKDPNRPQEVTRYLYDPKGRLKETYNEHQYLSFEYDRLGRVCREHHSDINEQRQRVRSSMVDIHSRHQWPGLPTHVALPDGQNLEYQYDRQHRLSAIRHNEQDLTQIERDGLGREVARTQGALTTFLDYDPQGRLQKQFSVYQKHQAPGPIHREYGYDAFGNLNQLRDGPEQHQYVYDLLDRLQRVEGSHPETFAFDPAGNLLRAGDRDSGIGVVKGNRLHIQGDRKFDYDARGNLIEERRGKGGNQVTSFKYNLNNQLIRTTRNGQSTHYRYDPLGRRIAKTDTFGTTRYLWLGDQLLQEQRNAQKKTYIYEPDSFKPVAMVQDEQVYHYHLDHLGTPRELTDTEGQIVWKARYKTYGNVAVKEVEEVENNLRFQGQYFDEESGLHYNRHRYYNPNTGQFTTQDPIGLLGGVNNYQYAPNPVGWVDPLGLACKENSWNTFQKNTKGHFPNSTSAAASFQRIKEVRAMDNAERPNATDYLPQSYIDAHEAKFAGGASYFAPKWALDEYGRENVGRADGQFVMTKPQMDDILVRSGGDIALIETELGIPAGDWQKNEMVVIEIADPKKHNVRIPTGREEGANDLWLPGGKLPTGHDEAVTDAIPKGAYREMSIAEATKNAKEET